MDVKKLSEHVHPLREEQPVRFKETGHVSEIMYSQHRNTECKIKKLSAEEYMRTDTGEVFQFEHIENRADDKNSVRQSLAKLRDYLNTNIDDVTFCRWVTLTYASRMTDTKKLHNDFKIFVKSMRRKYGHFEYIVAAEPQGDGVMFGNEWHAGTWHLHVVMIFKEKAPFIPNETMRDVWGKGFVTVKKLDDVDNVGAYLTAYLGDMECPDNETFPDGVTKTVEFEENGIKKTKKFIKGARLCLYPPQFNLYRCSRGIKKPNIEVISSKKAEKKVSSAKLTFERTIELSDEPSGYQNIINYRYYNTKRKDGTDKK